MTHFLCLVSLSLLIMQSSFCDARLYESPDESEARYGHPVTEPSTITMPLMKGTTEKWYHHNGWRIRSAYSKNQTIMITYQKRGRQSTPEARLMEDEIQAILNAETGGHYWKKSRERNSAHPIQKVPRLLQQFN